METGDQHDNSTHDALEKAKEDKKRAEWLAPWQYKKGQSGNPSGRPKGKSLKEYAKEKLQSMTEDEREVFLEGISKEKIWELAEGKADQKSNLDITIPQSLIALIKGDANQGGNTETTGTH